MNEKEKIGLPLNVLSGIDDSANEGMMTLRDSKPTIEYFLSLFLEELKYNDVDSLRNFLLDLSDNVSSYDNSYVKPYAKGLLQKLTEKKIFEYAMLEQEKQVLTNNIKPNNAIFSQIHLLYSCSKSIQDFEKNKSIVAMNWGLAISLGSIGSLTIDEHRDRVFYSISRPNSLGWSLFSPSTWFGGDDDEDLDASIEKHKSSDDSDSSWSLFSPSTWFGGGDDEETTGPAHAPLRSAVTPGAVSQGIMADATNTTKVAASYKPDNSLFSAYSSSNSYSMDSDGSFTRSDTYDVGLQTPSTNFMSYDTSNDVGIQAPKEDDDEESSSFWGNILGSAVKGATDIATAFFKYKSSGNSAAPSVKESVTDKAKAGIQYLPNSDRNINITTGQGESKGQDYNQYIDVMKGLYDNYNSSDNSTDVLELAKAVIVGNTGQQQTATYQPTQQQIQQQATGPSANAQMQQVSSFGTGSSKTVLIAGGVAVLGVVAYSLMSKNKKTRVVPALAGATNRKRVTRKRTKRGRSGKYKSLGFIK